MIRFLEARNKNYLLIVLRNIKTLKEEQTNEMHKLIFH